jgi:hypothetical protein
MSNKASRRQFLTHTGAGLGGLALSTMLPGGGILNVQAAESFVDPLAPKQPHFAAKAKSVIWLHQNGAPSTIDLFDYKPELERLNGQEVPASFLEGVKTSTQGGVGKLLATKRTWKQYGQSGAWFSDWASNIAAHADDIAFIKSSVTVGATHNISILKMNTSALNPGRPSLGAWVTYALGTNNSDLPAYVVLYHGKKEPEGGSTNWSSGFLPAVYQGTAFRQGDSPILFLNNPRFVSKGEERDTLDLVKSLNDRFASQYPDDTELQARTRSYELAYRMQSSAPEAVDLSKESPATKELYGLGDAATKDYGTNLLRARRLVERGVRFVHVVSGPPDDDITTWDAHHDIEKNHSKNAKMVDKPIAGLLTDLKQRGLLDSTLVVWISEFGRTPYGQSGDGRDHNPYGYTTWLAGGGVKAGTTIGATDDIGLKAAANPVDTYDVQATVLALLGLNYKDVTFLHNGRSERPTTVFGDVVKDLIA